MHVRCNEIAVDRAAADRSARVLPRMWVRPLPPRDASRLSGLAEAPALLIPCPCRVSGRLRSGSGHVSRFVRSLIQPSRQEGHRAQKLQISRYFTTPICFITPICFTPHDMFTICFPSRYVCPLGRCQKRLQADTKTPQIAKVNSSTCCQKSPQVHQAIKLLRSKRNRSQTSKKGE